jgi:hypothetical protein
MRLAHTAAQPLDGLYTFPDPWRSVVLRGLLGKQEKPRERADDVGPIPNGTLTRWLRQGIELGICPMCRVVHKADREYVWHFSEEGFGNIDTMAAMARAHGFCSEHAAMLTKIDLQMKSMLGVSTIYAELFGEITEEMNVLGIADAHCREGECPACANRADMLSKNARYLLASLAAPAGTIAEGYPDSPGLCFPHFKRVWDTGGAARARQILLAVQRRVSAQMLADLDEFIRKEGAEAKHEPKGSEQDAWQRAIWLTAGWPAPAQSAGVPETRYMHSTGYGGVPPQR